MREPSAAPWREWVADLPAELFPLSPEALLMWLRRQNRVPMLYWDQFRTRLLMHRAGEEWEGQADLVDSLAGVPWEF